MFCKAPASTRNLAWLITRVLCGSPLPEVTIQNVELESLGFEIESIPLMAEKINRIGWFKIEYLKGKTGSIVAKRSMPSQPYLDSVDHYTHDLVREIIVRSYDLWEHKKIPTK